MDVYDYFPGQDEIEKKLLATRRKALRRIAANKKKGGKKGVDLRGLDLREIDLQGKGALSSGYAGSKSPICSTS